MTNHSEKVAAILKAVELYAEAGRKASREIGQQAFTEAATMSWVENGKIMTVPITALYDALEQTGEEEVTYEVVDVNIAGNVAFVRIDSWFSKLASFNDMFTLAQQENGEWKIVSKIYSVK
ncbi:MAG: nuclear transport factor 2 family protein [Muribaculaceae bacterium]|nr:nuclear transport factor 2 family protein [Muribaculaceae bacterium]